MSYKIEKNHSLDEYNKKYANKNLKVVSKEDADKDESLLEKKTWWLIEDNYYEVEKKKCAFLLWWFNLAKAAKIALIAGCAAVVVAAVAVPVAISAANANNAPSISLEYHDVNDSWFDYTFDKSLKAIKTNEKQWNISVTMGNDACIDWYVVIGDVDYNVIAKSNEHAGKSVVGTYKENVVLQDGVNLSNYVEVKLHVYLFCASV